MKKENSFPVHVYWPMVKCFNCDLFQKIPINHGTLIKESVCPNCKTTSLHLQIIPNETNYEK